MRAGLVAIGAISLAACQAHMDSQPGSAMPYGPVNGGSMQGQIRYRNAGIQAVRDARRQDAYRQMYTACGGYYRIDGEGPESKGFTVRRATYGEGYDVNSTEWWVIQYSCVAPPQPAYQPAPAPYPAPYYAQPPAMAQPPPSPAYQTAQPPSPGGSLPPATPAPAPPPSATVPANAP